jgi:hypothetical protein
MINLLPPDVKQGYKFARINVSLRRWVICCVFALIGLGALATYGLATLHQSTNQYNSQIASSQALLTKEHYTQAQDQVKQISNSFKLVVKVLSQEVLFSEVLQQVAKAIPNNADLTGLNITQYGGALDITASAQDYQTATQLQVNLSNAGNKIFAKADLESINCSSSNTSVYPCTVTIRALFAQNNPFLFINSHGAGV